MALMHRNSTHTKEITVQWWLSLLLSTMKFVFMSPSLRWELKTRVRNIWRWTLTERFLFSRLLKEPFLSPLLLLVMSLVSEEILDWWETLSLMKLMLISGLTGPLVNSLLLCAPGSTLLWDISLLTLRLWNRPRKPQRSLWLFWTDILLSTHSWLGRESLLLISWWSVSCCIPWSSFLPLNTELLILHWCVGSSLVWIR